MPKRKKSRHPLFPGLHLPRLSRWQRFQIRLFVALVLILAFVIPASLYFHDMAGQMAMSDSKDMVTLAISETVHELMENGNYNYEYFVTLVRDNDGNISAITTNVGRINTISSLLMSKVITASDNGELDLQIPVGNLLGSNILLGRGPVVPVKISMLTSSRAEFKNELVSAGINQTKHQILLETVVDIDVLLPWQVLKTQVVTEVLVAETIIVGKVPETYLNLDGQEG